MTQQESQIALNIEGMNMSPNSKLLSPITPTLKARLTPLIILIFAVIGGLTPWLYQESQRLSAKREARFMASTIATQLNQLSAKSPLLWAYQPQMIERAIKPLERLDASIRCQLSNGRTIYQSPPRQTALSFTVNEYLRPSRGAKESTVQISVSISVSDLSDRLMIWLSGLLVASVIAWLLWTIPLKNAHKADTQNQELLTQVVDLNHYLERRVADRTAALERLNDRLLTIQEEERARISRDLHDELGQTLTGLRLHLTTLSLSAQPERIPLIQQSLDIVDLGIDQVRKIAYEQYPPELKLLGLIDAVKAIAHRITKAELLSVSVIGCDLPNLSESLSVALFRICQEGITNAIRHGSSEHINLSFSCENSLLIVRVDDDGNGVANELTWGGGLSGLQSRLKAHLGVLKVQDSPLGGIALISEIPISQLES